MHHTDTDRYSPPARRSGTGGLLAAAGLLAGLAFANARRAQQAEHRHPPVGRFVRLADGSRLHYVERGSGPPVVLIHGATMMLQDMMVSLMEPLAQRYRVIAIDRPGRGYSDRPRSALGVIGQARMIHEAIRALDLPPPILVGHSLGGTVALAYAIEFRAELAGLVVMAPFTHPMPRVDFIPRSLSAMPGLGTVLSHTVSPVFNRLMLPLTMKQIFYPNPVPEAFARAVPGDLMLRPSQLRADAEDFARLVWGAARIAPHYHEIDVPVAIIGGAADAVAPVDSHAGHLHAVIPDSSLEVLPGVGHMVHQIRPDAALAAIERVARLADERARQFALDG